MENNDNNHGVNKPNTNHNNSDGQEHEDNPNHVNVEERQQQQEHEEEEEEEEEEGSESDVEHQPPQPSRTPFTNLSQVDADLALARALQEQERAYMMLRMTNEGSDYGSWEGGSYVLDDEENFNDPHDDSDDDDDEDGEEIYDGSNVDDDEDAFDVHAHDEAGENNNPSIEFDPAAFSSDEAYARALQDAEDREMAARLLALAGINDGEAEDLEDHGGNSQDTWEEVDPDELSYEELIALGEVVGTESRGLSADTLASLPSVNYKSGSSQNGSNDSCVICRLDYEDGETLTVLSCKHSYHSECINNWLKINKVCPVCSAEVSISGNS
ncbi:E3 ubiquitin ligase BIG BROTHER-related [Juglans microcarpa x Juglans regia]|uniref:E3 ubiquitin ligase BIG BROTHER-related n=1 Tax=Juglans microcarpa x Juglans regia TaxID=2249226 RepID=UPI001B7F653D|nr:E3 ubiquitin ligase BIG BROTHER-related [Juglans microcarpa x Juglans regia]